MRYKQYLKYLNQYLGVYCSPDFPRKINIFIKNNILRGKISGQSSFPLEAYEMHKFKFDEDEIKLEFIPEENKMIFTQDRELEFNKE